MKPGCTLIAYLHAKPEKRDELLKILQSFVKPSRAESACVEYHLHVSNDDPNLFVFPELADARGTRSAPADADTHQLLATAPRFSAQGRGNPIHHHAKRPRLKSTPPRWRRLPAPFGANARAAIAPWRRRIRSPNKTAADREEKLLQPVSMGSEASFAHSPIEPS